MCLVFCLTDVYCSATLAGCPLPRKGFFTIRLLRITMSSSPAALLRSSSWISVFRSSLCVTVMSATMCSCLKVALSRSSVDLLSSVILSITRILPASHVMITLIGLSQSSFLILFNLALTSTWRSRNIPSTVLLSAVLPDSIPTSSVSACL